MKKRNIIPFALIAIGVLLLTYAGFSFAASVANTTGQFIAPVVGMLMISLGSLILAYRSANFSKRNKK